MKVFIAGPRAIKQLDKNVLKKLNSMSEKECEILIGDASGVDSLTQQYFKSIHYKNVEIYASNGKVRNNLNNWNVIDVPVENGVTGFNFYVQKDIQMAKDADYGFMIWNGESKGTFNNIINLLEQNKKVLLYLFNKEKFYLFKTINEFEKFLSLNIELNKSLSKILELSHKNDFKQVSLF